MTDPHPRYVCLFQEQDGARSLNRHPVAHVLDSWYCYREVYSTTGASHNRRPCDERARLVAATLNAEHDAWLAEDTP